MSNSLSQKQDLDTAHQTLGRSKHNYQLGEAVGIYEESHYINPGAKTRVAQEVAEKAIDSHTGEGAIRILDAGIGGGSLLLVGMIECLLDMGQEVEVVGIDNSNPMVDRLLDSNLKSIGFSKDIDKWYWEKDGSSVKVFDYDLESYDLPDNVEGRENFDIILSILTLHHLNNWRLTLPSLLNNLVPGGYLVLFEWTGCIKLRDGNFFKNEKADIFEVNNSVIGFWKELYEKRSNYHVWNPEISASDYEEVKKVLQKCGLMSISEGEVVEENWEEKVVTSDKVLRWIENKAYSNFHRGLTSQQHKELYKYAEDDIGNCLPEDSWSEKSGCRITLLEKTFNQRVCERDIYSTLSESPIHRKVRTENLVTKEDSGTFLREKILNHFSYLISQHDFIHSNTLFLTLNKWDLIEDDWDDKDKPIIFNTSYEGWMEFVKSMISYYVLIEYKKISATSLIFRDFPKRPTIEIHRDNGGILENGNKWDIDFFLDKSGNLDRLKIVLSDRLVADNNVSFFEENAIYDPKLWVEVRENIDMFRYNDLPQGTKDDERRVKNFSVNRILADRFSTNNGNIISEISSDFKDTLPDMFGVGPDGGDFSTEEFVEIILLHLTIPHWDQVTYMSTQSQVEGHQVGLGGLILFERNSTSDRLPAFSDERRPNLESVQGVVFRDLGISEYSRKVRYETVRESRHSSIISILSRSMSHDLGSHMLAHSELDDASSGFKELYFDNLTDYVRERMIFIAGAATGTPSWSRSFSFARDLLLEFLLLPTKGEEAEKTPVHKNIAKSEGINEIDFSVNGRIDSIRNKDLGEISDPLVDIPSGIVGKHALYIIIENIIRNSAKYGKSKEQMIIHVDIKSMKEEGKEDYFEIKVWDNLSVYNCGTGFRSICQYFPPDTYPDWVDDLYTDDTDATSSDPHPWRIVDAEGRTISGGWGIKEMRIAAAWLRARRPDVALEARDMKAAQEVGLALPGKLRQCPDPPLLEPVCLTEEGEEVEDPDDHEKEGSELFIGYKFRLLKPKEVMIVDPDPEHEDDDFPTGVDLYNELPEFSEESLRHSVALVNVSELGEESRGRLEENRDELPAALNVVGEDRGTRATHGINRSEYDDILVGLEDLKNRPFELLKTYQKWMCEYGSFFDEDGVEGMSVVLHINPKWHTNVSVNNEEVGNRWVQIVEKFNSVFGSVNCNLYVVKKGTFGRSLIFHEGVESRTICSPCNPSEKPDGMIVYDYHGEWNGNKQADGNKEPYRGDWIGEELFWQTLKGSGPTHSLLYNPPDEDWEAIKLTLNLALAGLTQACIIDERVHGGIGNTRAKFERAGIWVPTDVNYDQPERQSVTEVLDKRKSNLLVIHQGILDKMLGGQGECEEWVDMVREDKDIPFVVVVSDRGRPKNLPSNACFTPYASVERTIMSEFSKYHFTQAMLAANPSVHENNRKDFSE